MRQLSVIAVVIAAAIVMLLPAGCASYVPVASDIVIAPIRGIENTEDLLRRLSRHSRRPTPSSTFPTTQP